MNPKFNVGETVYYNDKPYIVTRDGHSQYNDVLYTVKSIVNGYKVPVYESNLLSKSEWEAKQKNNQNNIGRMAFQKSVKTKDNNECTCGAHKIKDAGHSSWCDIKN